VRLKLWQKKHEEAVFSFTEGGGGQPWPTWEGEDPESGLRAVLCRNQGARDDSGRERG